MGPDNSGDTTTSLSKRGARRVIQRAFVLMGRDKALRLKLRSVELTTRWTVEEWGLEWTVIVAAGHFEFYRGRVGKAQVQVRWNAGGDFRAHLESGNAPGEGFQLDCKPAARRHMDVVFKAFLGSLRKVLEDPVDDDGVRLV